MRITCQKCQATYSIAEKIIGFTGRMVKCARCDHNWLVQTPEIEETQIEHYPNLPVLFKPALPKCFNLVPILLILIFLLINFLFFPELLMRYKPLRELYEKCHIHDSQGLLLHSFTFELIGNDIIVQGSLLNSSNEDKIIPDIRYIALDNEKEVIFRYTTHSPNKIIKAGETWPIASKITNLNENTAYLQLDIGNKLELLLRK